MKILYGTSNPAKLEGMRNLLRDIDVEIIGLRDLDGDIPDVEENGTTPLDNAIIKAKAYYEAFGIPVFSCDSGLYFENLPQFSPGIHVRNVNGNRLNDSQMIEYYSSLVKEHGDIIAQYKNSICFIYDSEHIFCESADDMNGGKFIITSVPHAKRVDGFPLDCISKNMDDSYYYDNMTYDENYSLSGFKRFFKSALDNVKKSVSK